MIKRNISLFLIFVILITSCSSNKDESLTSDSGLIIGTWKPINITEACTTGSENIKHYSPCEQNGRITFEVNSSFSIKNFQNQNVDCVETFSSKGTWIIKDDELKLTFASDGSTVTYTFFKVSSNRLLIGFYDIYEDNKAKNYCDGNELRSHYYYESIRIE